MNKNDLTISFNIDSFSIDDNEVFDVTNKYEVVFKDNKIDHSTQNVKRKSETEENSELTVCSYTEGAALEVNVSSLADYNLGGSNISLYTFKYGNFR